jgi:hypothetical protein
MSLVIEAPEADELARRLAELTGEAVPEAVVAALRLRLQEEQERRRRGADRAARVDEVLRRYQAEIAPRPVERAEWDALWDRNT